MMATYQISPSGSESPFEPFTVEADTYQQAADRAARQRKVNVRASRNPAIHAVRVTGNPGMSGVFQAYVPLGNEGGETSVGGNFHVLAL